MAKKRRSRSRSRRKGTVKIGGSIFTQTACFSSKRNAKRAGFTVRKSKRKVRVIKTGSKRYCVYAGGRSKRKAA